VNCLPFRNTATEHPALVDFTNDRCQLASYATPRPRPTAADAGQGSWAGPALQKCARQNGKLGGHSTLRGSRGTVRVPVPGQKGIGLARFTPADGRGGPYCIGHLDCWPRLLPVFRRHDCARPGGTVVWARSGSSRVGVACPGANSREIFLWRLPVFA